MPDHGGISPAGPPEYPFNAEEIVKYSEIFGKFFIIDIPIVV